MLLTESAQLTELIVKALAYRALQTIEDLRINLEKSGHSYSEKAFYKELRKLQDLGVVLKHQQRYSLKLSWVIDLQALSERMLETSVTAFAAESVIDFQGEKRSWSFRSLAQLNPFWTQLMITLLRKSKSKTMYDWVPHPWFYLLHTKVELQFLSAIDQINARSYRIVGGETYLDQLAAPVWEKKPGKTVFGAGAFSEETTAYYVLIDDYVLTAKIDKKTAAALDRLYSETTSASKVNPSEINRVLTDPAKVSLVLEQHAERASSLRSRFHKHPGFKRVL